MSKFKKGDIVCLIFDEAQKFIVTNPRIGEDEVEVTFFCAVQGELKSAQLPEKYLTLDFHQAEL